MDPTRGPGRAEGDALREGGDGLTGGASLAGRGKRAQLREERRRHVGPTGQTQIGDSGDARDERLAWADMRARPAVGGARAERELGGEAKQAERSVGERAAGDARGLASAGSAGDWCTGLGQTCELRVAQERALGFGAWGTAGLRRESAPAGPGAEKRRAVWAAGGGGKARETGRVEEREWLGPRGE
ncbi:circumsporozoite protein-like [Panicum virgatum]|uniref:circumsporozoite protein-like n=1 Tax=Panicum virgatum TaxID=38727 RepID=UPI0019D577A6|nr:circumsporozoite protein-like [Panicum virgatum]